MSDDITFCDNPKCPHTKCMRYYTNVPTNRPYSIARIRRNVDGSCNYRFDTDWDTIEDVKILEE